MKKMSFFLLLLLLCFDDDNKDFDFVFFEMAGMRLVNDLSYTRLEARSHLKQECPMFGLVWSVVFVKSS